MNFEFDLVVGVFALFAAMLGLLELGHRLGARAIAHNSHGTSGTNALEGAIFALLGLLIAFTFFGAASRFDDRRSLIVQEANAIGTAYLRLDLLPPSARQELRAAFPRYVDHRLGAYRALPDMKAARIELERASELQQQIWAKAVAALDDTRLSSRRSRSFCCPP